MYQILTNTELDRRKNFHIHLSALKINEKFTFNQDWEVFLKN